MKRIIIHWTGGTNSVSELDRQHYHFIIDGDGKVHEGNLKPEANLDCTDGNYAAHTRRCNTGAIGVALAGMHGATDFPLTTGKYPLTSKQIDALIELCADLCETYGIKVTPKTVLTHAEVEPTLGIKQRGKWDIRWLPGMTSVGGAIEIGDQLRRGISNAMRQEPNVKIRTSPAQSKEVRASAAQVAAGAGAGVSAVAALDGAAQIVAIAFAGVVCLLALYLMRKRLQRWAQGDR